ncbi:hypothetical protein GCM10010347_63250 [Streptomyces cirratus]|uniref:Uncharacterized protein n=1 Tax=Streptomyces cirratus TaxID=68187 RepID=A0ABQ3F207_9ACTN|nr:hypothetical protein GCM10010347_63250 [Streptomyces cirratus]
MPDGNARQGQNTVGEFVIPAEIADLNLFPATEVKPEDVGALTLARKDGAPVLTSSWGTVAPVVGPHRRGRVRDPCRALLRWITAVPRTADREGLF